MIAQPPPANGGGGRHFLFRWQSTCLLTISRADLGIATAANHRSLPRTYFPNSPVKHLLPSVLLSLSAPSLIAGAPQLNAPAKAPKNATVLQEPTSKWSVSAGFVVRNIESSRKTRPLGFGLDVSGRGDVGLFSRSSGTVIYDDGRVGPDWGLATGSLHDGTAFGTINSPDQITSTGRIDAQGEPISDLTFHSTRATNQSIFSPTGLGANDSKSAVGPYIDLAYSVFQSSKFNIDIHFGYSWVQATLNEGFGTLARQGLDRVTDTYSYTYDFYPQLSNFGAPLGPFPYADQDGTIVYDGDRSNSVNGFSGGGNKEPRTGHSQSARRIASYIERGEAPVKVNLHEIILAPEIAFQVGKRMHAGLTVGPTLNVIDTELRANVAWYRSGSTAPFKTINARDSDILAKLGVASQLTVRYDLTKRLFLEAAGSYRYVPKADVSSDFSTAMIDVSAWQANIGIGYRF